MVDEGNTVVELAAEVPPDSVKSLLIARAPGFMDVDSDRHDSFITIVRGVAVEVVAVTGADPEGTIRALAVWAVTLGAAAHIEASLAPEQVLGGEAGPAQVLKSKYLGVLAQLRTQVGLDTVEQGFSGSLAYDRGGW